MRLTNKSYIEVNSTFIKINNNIFGKSMCNK